MPGSTIIRRPQERKRESIARGFFPPEMCYSPEIVPVIEEAGYRWLVISGTSCDGPWPQDFVSRIAGTRVRVIFRDEIVSNKISFDRIPPQEFLKHLQTSLASFQDAYLVTAMDAETFGHPLPVENKVLHAERNRGRLSG